MTPLEAFVSVFDDIFYLKDLGINVEFNKSVSATKPEIVERFSDDPKRIPSKNWVYVTFSNLNKRKRNEIFKIEDGLGEFGISFDTDATKDTHNWSLDWSFVFDRDNDNKDWKNRRTLMTMDNINPSEIICLTCDVNSK